ncbi:MAG: hypothetical protein EZS28_003779 [Streblomastix strix]|uniref:Uncharacterized protein n=1 Tax=Streblomastix strix TaxID=222440 RepID=A0A5J4X1S5_9EUKA|nr:MAG: hypothetical protein EZS28_003779 [Streblomastix strix]
MYETEWYNSGDMIPDQVTPASDAIPSNSIVNGSAGTSNEYTRGDNQHPLQFSTVLPAKDTANGEAGVATTYARTDHIYHVNLSNDVPLKDTGNGTAGASNVYASAIHQHPLNIDPTTANVPLINATAAANGTTTKFIKTGGLATEILCANGDTTTIDSKLSRTYSSVAGGYIRLCVFPIGTSTGAPYIQFQVQCNTNAMQTIDLVPYYTVNGIIDLFGNIIAPQYVQANYNIYYGVDQLIHTHTGSYSSAVYTAWIHMMTGSGSVTVSVSNQSPYMTNRITEILTQDIVSSISGSQTQIPISYNLGNGGIQKISVNSTMHESKKPIVELRIRISRSTISDYSGIYPGCGPNSTTGTMSGQWSILNTNAGEFRIGVGEQLFNDNQGLKISADGNTLTFNGRVL